MTRTLGAALATDLAAPTAEKTELIHLDFADLSNNPTPVYITTAAKDILWNGITWQAVGGHLEVDALGETTDGQATGLRIKLSGIDQTILASILGARWRGRQVLIYYAHLDQATGAVVADPVLLFKGLMNGGFEIGESRGEFGGGTVDITTRLTAKLTELVRVRGVRTNVHSHQAAIPGATTDTFFQNVALLPLRKVFWGMKAPYQGPLFGGFLPIPRREPPYQGPLFGGFLPIPGGGNVRSPADAGGG